MMASRSPRSSSKWTLPPISTEPRPRARAAPRALRPMSGLGKPALGIASRGGRIAVHAAEIPLPVDERQAHGELLRQAYEGVVDRQIPVRVIFAHHLAHNAGAFHVLLVPVDAEPAHAVEDAPMHGLQPVAHVGQRARYDHAHGVIEIGSLQLALDGDGDNVAPAMRSAAVTAVFKVFVCQAEISIRAFAGAAFNR